jgi:hypothetical protein
MSIELLTTMAVSSVATELVSKFLERRKGSAPVDLGRDTATPPDVRVIQLEDLPPEARDWLQKRLRESPRPPLSTIALLRSATASRAQGAKTVELDPRVGGAALAIDSGTVFDDARRRISLVFKLNLGLAIALAVILLGGLVGAIIAGLVFNKNAWGLAFGGISGADLIGIYLFKPLTAINSALVATQRLDALHLRVHEQLKTCVEYSDLDARIRCQTQVWEAMQKELAVLAGKGD